MTRQNLLFYNNFTIMSHITANNRPDSPNFYRRIASEMWRETLKFPYPGKWRERRYVSRGVFR